MPATMVAPLLVDVARAAELLAVEGSTIRKWLSQGRLTRVKVGGCTRIRFAELEAVIANGLPPRGRNPARRH
jgi:excisionase family DNA binding protein